MASDATSDLDASERRRWQRRARRRAIASWAWALLAALAVALWIRGQWRADLLTLTLRDGGQQWLSVARGKFFVVFSNIDAGEERSVIAWRSIPVDEYVPEGFVPWPHQAVRRGRAGFEAVYASDPVAMGSSRYLLLAWPTWFVCLLFLALFARGRIVVNRLRRRALAGLCRHCGYDLRASGAVCPECGSTR